ITGQKDWYGYDACKHVIDKFDKDNVKYPEQANNNLHIWELGEVLKNVGSNIEDSAWWFKVLAPIEIAKLNKIKDKKTRKWMDAPYGARNNNADVIVGFNGPMAHVYVTDLNRLGKAAEIFRLTFQEADASEALLWWQMDELDYKDFKENTIGRMKASVDRILIRVSDKYDVFAGLNANGSIRTVTADPFQAEYVEAWTRIAGMDDKQRSGDIVLIMKDFTMGEAIYRYTTGVACKAWHGSLNASDSYVPLIISYPGGNKTDIENILKKDSLCNIDYSSCKGNWSLTNIVKGVVLEQFK
ncbi:MAG: hypothetical protein K4571_01340, partial [Deltaproteobacteria bacterium]